MPTSRPAPRLRRLATAAAGCALAGLSAVLITAAPASAEDTWALDERLVEAGFVDAVSYPYATATDGIRMQVEYASDSDDDEEYEREAAQIAELVWDHADGHILAVDVYSVTEVTWTDSGLPAAVSFSRDELQETYGNRPQRLDGAEPTMPEEAAIFMAIFLGVLSWAVGLAMGLGVWGLFALLRGDRKNAHGTFPAAHDWRHGQPTGPHPTGVYDGAALYSGYPTHPGTLPGPVPPGYGQQPGYPAPQPPQPNTTGTSGGSMTMNPFGDIDPNNPWQPPSR